VTSMSYMFDNADALSDVNKCAIHTSFESQKPSEWTYDWDSYCS
jgi:hypothetical protein